MKGSLRVWMMAFAFGVATATSVGASEHTRVTVPDALSVELLGRGLLWSVNYDRVLSDDLAAGFGFGTTGTKTVVSGVDTNTSAKVVPFYVNYYFMREQGSPFVTGGADILLNASEVKTYKSSVGNVEFNSNTVLPNFGVGYENRSEAGFMIRAAVYGVIAKDFNPWFGFTFGYAW